MQRTRMAAAAVAALARAAQGTAAVAAGVPRDVLAGAPFNLNSGDESDIAVARYTGTTGIACYLGPEIQGHGQRGRCNLVEGGAKVGDTLVQVSDRTLHNAMASLTDKTSIWCYADSENSFELKCRKVNRDGDVLSVEPSGEISIKGNSVNVLGSSVLSATRFSDTTAVMCADNPRVQEENPETKGPLQCALLRIKPANDTWCESCLGVNSNSGIVLMDTDSILTLSIVSFDENRGAVCYASSASGSNKVSCTLLTLSGSDESDSTLTVGATVVISADAGSAAATSLSADAAIVCYAGGTAGTSCSRLELSGDTLSKGEEMQISQAPVSHLTLESFSSETVVACFHVGGGAACSAMNTEDGSSGDALTIDDVAAGQDFALTSMTDTAGLLCYTTAAGRGVCRDLQVLPKTTTTQTSTATTISTTTFATETGTTVSASGTETSGTQTSTSATETSTTPHTTTETSSTPHTTTETSTTVVAEEQQVLSRAAGPAAAAAAAGWTAAALLGALDLFAC